MSTSRQRWQLVGLGLIMSAASVFILIDGVSGSGGLPFEIAGAICTLFFVPLTLILIASALRLGVRKSP